MSNMPVQFKSKPRKDSPPLEVEVDGESFLFAPTMGTKALEPLGRLSSGDFSGLFDMLKVLIVDPEDTEDGSSYQRFVDLDLDMADLVEFAGVITGMYGISEGESVASSTPSVDGGANSTPTSNGSTPSTSRAVSTPTLV